MVKTMFEKGLDAEMVKAAISLHKVDYDLLAADDFDSYFIDRAKKLLNRIELSTGKKVSGRDSEETARAFGGNLE